LEIAGKRSYFYGRKKNSTQSLSRNKEEGKRDPRKVVPGTEGAFKGAAEKTSSEKARPLTKQGDDPALGASIEVWGGGKKGMAPRSR